MAAPSANRRPRAGSRWWRRLRRALLLLLLVLSAALWWLDRVGFPEPARRWLQAQLHRHGWEATTGPLRLQWPRGLVADELVLRHAATAGLELHARQVRLRPDWGALLRGRFELARLDLESGRLTLASKPEPEAPERVVFEQLEGRLETAGRGVWRLAGCRALVLGCRVALEAVVTNTPPAPGAAGPVPPSGTDRPGGRASLDLVRLRELIAWVDRLGLHPPPEVRLTLSGDTADPASFAATLGLAAPAAAWGGWQLAGLVLDARLRAAGGANPTPALSLSAQAASIESAGSQWSGVRLEAAASLPEGGGWPTETTWRLEADAASWEPVAWESLEVGGRARWTTKDPPNVAIEAEGQARQVKAPGTVVARLKFQGSGQYEPAGARAWRWDAEVEGRELAVEEWGRFRRADLFVAGGSMPSEPGPEAAELPEWIRPLLRWAGMTSLRLQDGAVREIPVEEVELAANWTPPELLLPLLAVRTAHGTLQVRDAALDLPSRRVEAVVRSDADLHRLDPWWPEGMRRWLGQFAWEVPPVAEARVEAVLPPRETPPPEWGRRLLATARVRGHLEGTNSAYRAVPFQSVRFDLALDGPTLRLRNMRLERPEGGADLEYTLGLLSREFHWRFDCRLNPKAVAPAVDRHLVPILDPFEFDQAAWVCGDAWGTFKPPKRTDLALQIDAAGFRFKDRPVDRLTTALFLTNRTLIATNLQLAVGDQWARADRVIYEPDRRRLEIREGRVRMDPMLAAAWIGAGVERTLAPYRFGEPPEVDVAGSVFVGGGDPAAKLTFGVRGGPFEFWRLGFAGVNGRVEWRGDRVRIGDFDGAFHDGRVTGSLEVTARPGEEPRVAFAAAIRQARLPSLVREVFGVTNRLEGRLDADLVVTNGVPSDWRSWCGHGRAAVENGLLWDLPVLGVVSRALNTISPGLGNNQATAARGTFVLDHGVVRTSDTRIDCRTVQLDYAGACTLTGELDARVTVRLLGKTPVVGPFLGFLLAPVSRVFELSLTGRLGNPRVEFTHIAPLTAPLTNPWRTLRRVFEPQRIRPAPGAPSNRDGVGPPSRRDG
ncbi:MAG: hypothetical protein D6766_00290 [Verrucomicrobia bacterium]|nr:MAG: hypothetical protein D6766_00290 [Verrucomicrobiota bacterium]